MDSGELLLVAAAGMLVVAAVAQTAAAGLVQPRIALAFGAPIAPGEGPRLSLESGRESAPVGSARPFAYAVVLTAGGQPALQPAPPVIAVGAAGVAATAILIAFAADMMGLAALGVFIAPLLVTQMAFRRYAGIRATYLETVRALARVPEVGGYVEDGHARRVGRLAVLAGRE